MNEEQGSFFHPDDHKVAWSKEEMKPVMEQMRQEGRARQLARANAHNQAAADRISNGFHDRRPHPSQKPALTEI